MYSFGPNPPEAVVFTVGKVLVLADKSPCVVQPLYIVITSRIITYTFIFRRPTLFYSLSYAVEHLSRAVFVGETSKEFNPCTKYLIPS